MYKFIYLYLDSSNFFYFKLYIKIFKILFILFIFSVFDTNLQKHVLANDLWVYSLDLKKWYEIFPPLKPVHPSRLLSTDETTNYYPHPRQYFIPPFSPPPPSLPFPLLPNPLTKTVKKKTVVPITRQTKRDYYRSPPPSLTSCPPHTLQKN